MRNRRVVSILLVCVLLFTLAVNAFAAEEKIEDVAVDEFICTVHDYLDTKTVYIDVFVENNPELLSLNGIYDAAIDLYEKQSAYDDGTFVLMSKNHIAGELALHVFLFRLFSALGGSSEDSMFHEYYDGAKVACLNIDENRLSPVIMEMVGVLVLAFGSVSA